MQTESTLFYKEFRKYDQILIILLKTNYHSNFKNQRVDVTPQM